jgi:hypothetical protein
MSNPIGDAAEKAQRDAKSDLENAVNPNAARSEAGLPMYTPDNQPKKVDLTDMNVAAVQLLTQVQNAFIKAQTQFIHDKDLGALATAQENHIEGLTAVLERFNII